MKKATKCAGKNQRCLQIEPNNTYMKYKESADMSLVAHLVSQPNLFISPTWTSILKRKSQKYNLCSLDYVGKFHFYVGTI